MKTKNRSYFLSAILIGIVMMMTGVEQSAG